MRISQYMIISVAFLAVHLVGDMIICFREYDKQNSKYSKEHIFN